MHAEEGTTVVCDFCQKETDEFIQVEVEQTEEPLMFCHFHCVAAFAMTRMKTLNDQANTRIVNLAAELSELEQRVSHLRAGNQA